jgi:uncharacterized protein
LILVDANLLIYAADQRSDFHLQAKAWLDQQMSGISRVGLPWSSLLAFLRVTTNSRIYERPASMTAAWQRVSAWLQRRVVWIPGPTARHAEVLGQFLLLPDIRGKLVPDADLAALAVEHGLILCSADGDFARFPGLRWENPLSGYAS